MKAPTQEPPLAQALEAVFWILVILLVFKCNGVTLW